MSILRHFLDAVVVRAALIPKVLNVKRAAEVIAGGSFRGHGKRFLLKGCTLSLAREKMLSEAARRTKIVFDAVMALHDAGDNPFRPGDVVARLRDDGRPYGAWEVRGELTKLERLGLIELDEDLAVWRLVDGATFSIEAAKALSKT